MYGERARERIGLRLNPLEALAFDASLYTAGKRWQGEQESAAIERASGGGTQRSNDPHGLVGQVIGEGAREG